MEEVEANLLAVVTLELLCALHLSCIWSYGNKLNTVNGLLPLPDGYDTKPKHVKGKNTVDFNSFSKEWFRKQWELLGTERF